MAAAEGRFFARIPWGVVFVWLLIPLMGAINLSSAAEATRPNLHLLQLAWLGVSLAASAVVIRIRTRFLELAAYPVYGAVCTLLVLVLVAGTTVKGAQRWLNLGFFMLQPSELAKIAVILVTARYFSQYREPAGYTLVGLLRPLNLSRPLGLAAFLVYRWFKQAKKHAAALEANLPLDEIPTLDPTWMKVAAAVVVALWIAISILELLRRGVHHRRIIAPVDVPAIPFVLVLIEPDLGTSLIVIAIAGIQILFCGLKRSSLIIALSSATAFATTVLLDVKFQWGFLLKAYQRKRVETFLNPENDLQGAGYHSSQSMIAIGSGGLTGKGHNAGTQTQLSFLPENHTDFVFSVLAEEWGFVGGTVVILVFLALILLILRDARDWSDRFAVLVSVGAAAMLFLHVVINIGMVTGLLPVVGMTLPFLSYGGSSMVTQTLAVALAVNASVWRKM